MTTVWSTAVARAFTASRGLCLVGYHGSAAAVVVATDRCQSADSAAAGAPLSLSWGLGTGSAVALVFLFALRRDGRAPTIGPMQSGMAEAAVPESAPAEHDLDALRSLAFIKLCVAMFIANFIPLALSIHLIPLLSAGGLTRDEAVIVGGSYGSSMVVGQIVSGLAIDRMSGRLVTALWFAVLIASLSLLRCRRERSRCRSSLCFCSVLLSAASRQCFPNLPLLFRPSQLRPVARRPLLRSAHSCLRDRSTIGRLQSTL